MGFKFKFRKKTNILNPGGNQKLKDISPANPVSGNNVNMRKQEIGHI